MDHGIGASPCKGFTWAGLLLHSGRVSQGHRPLQTGLGRCLLLVLSMQRLVIGL